MLTKDVLAARLSGAEDCTILAVRHKRQFHLVAPERLGGFVDDVPADSLTDCVNWSVSVLGEELKRTKKKKGSS